MYFELYDQDIMAHFLCKIEALLLGISCEVSCKMVLISFKMKCKCVRIATVSCCIVTFYECCLPVQKVA